MAKRRKKRSPRKRVQKAPKTLEGVPEMTPETEAEETGLVETLYSRRPMTPAHMPSFLKKKYSVRQKKAQKLQSKRRARQRARQRSKRRQQRAHYKIVCISLYAQDIERLDGHVRYLKSKGFSKANKSQIIRFALDRVLIDQLLKAS